MYHCDKTLRRSMTKRYGTTSVKLEVLGGKQLYIPALVCPTDIIFVIDFSLPKFKVSEVLFPLHTYTLPAWSFPTSLLWPSAARDWLRCRRGSFNRSSLPNTILKKLRASSIMNLVQTTYGCGRGEFFRLFSHVSSKV